MKTEEWDEVGLTWLCFNEDCRDKSKLSEGSTCPSCGSPVRNYGFTESIRHMNAKDQARKVAGTMEKSEAKMLFSPEMADEDLSKAIYEDMLNLASHEAGTGWARLSAILSGSQADLLLAQLLKALVDQNKILIRQNELILRALRSQ